MTNPTRLGNSVQLVVFTVMPKLILAKKSRKVEKEVRKEIIIIFNNDRKVNKEKEE